MGKGLQKTISIAVVALNEEVLIEETVVGIIEQVRNSFNDYELLLVNDGSQDQTANIMNQLAIKHDKIRVLHNEKNIGLGASFKRAIKEAKCNYFMLLCGDGGLPSESLKDIFHLVGKADLIIPYMANLTAIKTPTRYIISRCYTKLLNLLFRQNLHYYNGLPVYRSDLLLQLNIVSSGFGFQGEILTKLLKAGCSYMEVEVLGAEKANRSRAINVKNLINITKTFSNLVWEIALFKPSSIKRL